MNTHDSFSASKLPHFQRDWKDPEYNVQQYYVTTALIFFLHLFIQHTCYNIFHARLGEFLSYSVCFYSKRYMVTDMVRCFCYIFMSVLTIFIIESLRFSSESYLLFKNIYLYLGIQHSWFQNACEFYWEP